MHAARSRRRGVVTIRAGRTCDPPRKARTRIRTFNVPAPRQTQRGPRGYSLLQFETVDWRDAKSPPAIQADRSNCAGPASRSRSTARRRSAMVPIKTVMTTRTISSLLGEPGGMATTISHLDLLEIGDLVVARTSLHVGRNCTAVSQPLDSQREHCGIGDSGCTKPGIGFLSKRRKAGSSLQVVCLPACSRRNALKCRMAICFRPVSA